MTPQVFWSGVRVEEAMRRVAEGSSALTDVALDLGFSAPRNFSRFFKEHTGVSPSIFKRAAREPSPAAVTGIPREQSNYLCADAGCLYGSRRALEPQPDRPFLRYSHAQYRAPRSYSTLPIRWTTFAIDSASFATNFSNSGASRYWT